MAQIAVQLAWRCVDRSRHRLQHHHGPFTAAHALCHRHMAAHPEQWDYSRAAIPSALTDEMAQHQEARAVRGCTADRTA